MNRNEFVLTQLREMFPNAKCELEYSTIFELLVAVVLSAQCTDKRVNIVTKELFKKYNTPTKMANADYEDVCNIIKTCGMYKQKAKHLIECSKRLLENFGGEIPKTIEELTTLDGVGRKTASVVLAEGMKIPAIAVDTHVFRVSNRLGFSNTDKVEVVEKNLKNLFNQNDWIELHFLLVMFGRYFCKAQKPNCEQCKFTEFCKYYNKN